MIGKSENNTTTSSSHFSKWSGGITPIMTTRASQATSLIVDQRLQIPRLIGDGEGALWELGELLSKAPLSLADFSFGSIAEFLPAAPCLMIQALGRTALPVVDSQAS